MFSSHWRKNKSQFFFTIGIATEFHSRCIICPLPTQFNGKCSLKKATPTWPALLLTNTKETESDDINSEVCQPAMLPVLQRCFPSVFDLLKQRKELLFITAILYNIIISLIHLLYCSHLRSQEYMLQTFSCNKLIQSS